jgi:hypothetical protein
LPEEMFAHQVGKRHGGAPLTIAETGFLSSNLPVKSFNNEGVFYKPDVMRFLFHNVPHRIDWSREKSEKSDEGYGRNMSKLKCAGSI